MNPSTIVRNVAALYLLLASNAASATVLTLTMPDGYSLDLPAQCASDPRCQHQAGLPMALSPGLFAGQAIMPASASDFSHVTSSFAADAMVDDAFLSLTDNQSTPSPDVPVDRNDAAGEAVDDDVLQRKLILGMLQTYTSIRALVSLPGHYLGNTRDAANMMCDEGGTADAIAGCAADSFAPVMGSLCVGRDGSYNTFGAANQAACPAGSIFVGSKRGAGTAEYAAHTQSLRNFAKDTVNHYNLQSLDDRYTRNEANPMHYRRCSECDLVQGNATDPGPLLQVLRWLKEPESMLLVGLGLVALLGADALLKARRN